MLLSSCKLRELNLIFCFILTGSQAFSMFFESKYPHIKICRDIRKVLILLSSCKLSELNWID